MTFRASAQSLPAKPEGQAGSNFSPKPFPLRACLPLLFGGFVFVIAGLTSAYIYSGCCIIQRPPIRSDGFGYYAYLPAVFIDHDLTMRTPLANRWTVVGKHPPPGNWTGITKISGTKNVLDKYTSGTALLQAPFFIVAHTVARAFRLPPYSAPYQAANVVSGLTFFSIGTYLLLRCLLMQFSIRTSILSILAIVFGTNVFHYATFDGSFSHVYSYFLLTALLTLVGRYRAYHYSSPATIYCLCMGATLGLIVLTRVPNIIVAVILLALISERYYRTGSARTLAFEVLTVASAFLVVFSLQLAYWHSVTGQFLVNSYQGERFNWQNPQVLNFLFSVRKGLFTWSPLLIVAVLGLPLLVKADRVLGLAICGVLALEVYICSSWWSWWFGAGFGSRPFVDMMPLLAVPLAFGIEWTGARIWRFAPVLAVAILIPLNLFLMVSFWNQLIPWDNASIADMARLPARWETHPFLIP